VWKLKHCNNLFDYYHTRIRRVSISPTRIPFLHKSDTMGTQDSSALSVAAFTALGTIVGYLGTEVASFSTFGRMLWTSRFYNSSSPKSFLAYIFLMPIGGPIHKAAVEALDKLMGAGLWKGYCRGDMLGTYFFEDTKQSFVVRGPGGGRGPRREARNGFWITALSLIPWQPQFGHPVATRDEETAKRHEEEVRSRRPVCLLRLIRADSNSTEVSEAELPVVNDDTSPKKVQHFAAIFSSEIIALIVGLVTAVVWKSIFSVWYLIPLLLKMTALAFQVSQKELMPPSNKPEDNELILCEIEDISKGFFLIEGTSELVLQFFRHYGHPNRYRRGIRGDRVREVMSMLTVTTTIFLYPGGLIAFIFAPTSVQWVWLGYQLYATLTMHVYRFSDEQHIGTTQKWIGRELHHKNQVLFDDRIGNKVVARLETSIVDSVAEGRLQVESVVEQILQKHAMQVQTA
jgi:hypothetical protein